MTRSLHRHSPGFTLIELIVVIVMFGFLAAMLAPFIGSALTRSHEPIQRLGQSLEVNECMSKLVAECRDTKDGLEELKKCVTETFNDGCPASFEIEQNCIKFKEIEDQPKTFKDESGSCSDPDAGMELLKVEIWRSFTQSQRVIYLFTP